MHPELVVKLMVVTGAPFRSKKAPSGYPLDAHQYAEMFTGMVSRSAVPHLLSMADRDTFSYTSKRLRKQFGHNGFNKINNRLRLIEVGSNYDRTDRKQTREYWVSHYGGKFFEKCREVAVLYGLTKPLYEPSGRRIRTRKNGIFGTDNQGQQAVSNARIRWAIPVNLDAIESALNITGLPSLFPDTNAERLASMEMQLGLIQLSALNDKPGRGLLPQVYCEDQSGRLNGCSGVSLQHMRRELRPIVLAGTHEYDFQNCHWRILRQKTGIQSPVIEHYIRNYKQVRQGIADRCGITCENAKTALISLLFGVTQGKSTKHTALPKLLGQDQADRLYKDPDWIALRGAVRESRKAMIADAQKFVGGGYRAGKTSNVRGKAREGTQAQILAHLLQGWDAELLHLVLRRYGDNIILLQHDGWTMETYVDPAEIEALIAARTGLIMPITHTPMTNP